MSVELSPPAPEGELAVSIIVPALRRLDDPEHLLGSVAAELAKTGTSAEILVVVDDGAPAFLTTLRELKASLEIPLSIIVLAKAVGEATALAVGFEAARGEVIVTLAPYPQFQDGAVSKILENLELTGVDLVVACRRPRLGGSANRLMGALFHGLVRRVTASDFHDLGAGLRAMTREVAGRLNLYGDLQRFIPIMAQNLGFRVKEKDLPQHERDRPRRLYGPAVYARRLLDLLTIFFLVKFTARPLRFFGSIGIVLTGIGASVTGYLGVTRLMGSPIADRPLLLLGILLMVLGVQSISIGLLGEIIIFTHARQIKGYRISEIH